MVKDIEKAPDTNWDLPAISIEGSELIDLLVNLVGDGFQITATTAHKQFESAADIRDNLHHFKDNPTVYIHKGNSTDDNEALSIDFKDGKSFISYTAIIDKDTTNEFVGLAIKIQSNLKAYRSYFRDENKVMFSLLSVSLGIGFLTMKLFSLTSTKWDIFPAVIAAILTLYLGLLLFTEVVPSTAVRFNPRETWWQRYKGEMVKDILLLVIGAGIMWVFTKYTGTPPST